MLTRLWMGMLAEELCCVSQPVLPDIVLKSSPIFTKHCPKSIHISLT